MIIVSQTCPPIIFPDLLITSCPTLLCTRGVPNENKMRHNLPFRNNITIEIQNMLPLAWSRRNGFFRSRSRSRLRNSQSVCLQTLPMLFFLHSHCFEVYKLGLLYAYVSPVIFYQDKRRPRKNTKPNNKHYKKGLIKFDAVVLKLCAYKHFRDLFLFLLLIVKHSFFC